MKAKTVKATPPAEETPATFSPTKKLSVGEQSIRIEFDDDVCSIMKGKTAELINMCSKLKGDSRLADLAIQYYEIASMLATKAATA